MKTNVLGSALEKLFWYGGILLILLSGGLIVTYVGELIAGETRHGVASQLGLITFLCGLVFVGYKLVSVQLNEKKAVKELTEEQTILNLAKSNAGSLTVSQTALDCRLRISDTKKAFERLSMTGVCQVDVTQQGELYYRFPTFESLLEDDSQLLVDDRKVPIRKPQLEADSQ